MTETKYTVEYIGREVFVTVRDDEFHNRPRRLISCTTDDARLSIHFLNGQYEVVLYCYPDPDDSDFTTEIRANWEGNSPIHTGFQSDDDDMAFWLGFVYEKLGISIPVVKTIGFYKPEE